MYLQGSTNATRCLQDAAVKKFLAEWKKVFEGSKSRGYLKSIANVINHVRRFIVDASPGANPKLVVVKDIIWNQNTITAFYTYLITKGKVQSSTAEAYIYCLIAFLHQNAIGFSLDKNTLKTVFRAGNIDRIDQVKVLKKAKETFLSLQEHKKLFKLVDEKIRSLPRHSKQLFELLPLEILGLISYQQGLRLKNMLVPDNDEERDEFMDGVSRGTKKWTYVYPPDTSHPWVHYEGPWNQFENVAEQELYFKDIWIFEKTPKNPKPKNFILRTSLSEETRDDAYPFSMGVRELSDRYNQLIDHWSRRDETVKKGKEMKYFITTKGTKRDFCPCSTRTFKNTANRVVKSFIKAKLIHEGMKFSTTGMKRVGVSTSISNELITGTQFRTRHSSPEMAKKYWHAAGPVEILKYQLMYFSPGDDNDRAPDI